MAYSYLTLAQIRSVLLARLQDANAVYTTVPEANLYITEALRALSAQTMIWNTNYVFNFNAGDTWKSLNVAGSPRQRTVTDTYIYNQMEAMLLEPMSGGTWTGTSQYNISLLSAALQYRRDELLLQSAANTLRTLQSAPVLSVRSTLLDSTLDLFRVRYIASDSSMPYVLGREDVNTANAFGPMTGVLPGPPESWMITANSPLQFDVNRPPNEPAVFDLLTLVSGVPFIPPTASVLGLPDDWTWVAMYGALADVLANAPEGRDSARAKYCLHRYEQGRKAMLKLPWMIEASVGGIPVDTPSYKEMDSWLQNWESVQPASDPNVVVGGVDFVALAPFVPLNSPSVSTVLTVIGNAPIPANDAAFVQLSRDGVDAILAYAQHVASFKMGGRDFEVTLPLFEQFEAYCRRKNSQYAVLGIFRPETVLEGNRVEGIDPRFDKEPEHGKKTG